MICTPIGRPPSSCPIGMVVAGSQFEVAIPAQAIWSPYGTFLPSTSSWRARIVNGSEHQPDQWAVRRIRVAQRSRTGRVLSRSSESSMTTTRAMPMPR